MTRYGVAVDGSAHGKMAFEWTAQHAGKDDHVCILTVVERIHEITPTSPLGAQGAGIVLLLEHEKRLKDHALSQLQHYSDQLMEAEIPHSCTVLHGHPKQEIVDAAESKDLDVLVVGCRGLGTIERLLIGSVSEYCVRHCHCTVVVVKGKKTKPKEAAAAAAAAAGSSTSTAE